MCDKAFVMKLIDDKIASKEMFTAFDITQTARKLTTDKVYHSEVKDIVHDMFLNSEMVDYMRTLASLPNVSPQPWLYYHRDDNPFFYGQTVQTTNPPQVVVPIQTSTIPVQQFVQNDEVYEVDSRGTLCIPSSLVRDLGLQSADYVFAYNDGQCLVLKRIDDGKHLAKYKVDCYDNVRVTKATLDDVGLNGKEFTINFDKDKIVVRVV